MTKLLDDTSEKILQPEAPGLTTASGMATENTPLLNTIAEDGPLSDFAAATVLLQLIDCVERRESYCALCCRATCSCDRTATLCSQTQVPGAHCPPRPLALGSEAPMPSAAGDKEGQGTSQGSVFAAPESADGAKCSAAPAYVWNLGGLPVRAAQRVPAVR